MPVLALGDVARELGAGPYEVRSFNTVGELEEAIIQELQRDAAVLAVYPGAWQRYSFILKKIKSEGLNQYLYLPVDTIELKFIKGVSIKEFILSKYIYLTMSMGRNAQFRVTLAKPVSRRTLIRAPHRAIRDYVGAPVLLNPEACRSWQHCNLCLSSCPVNALVGKPPTVNLDACTECGVCASACPFGLLFMPRGNLKALEQSLDIIRKNIKDKKINLIVSCISSINNLLNEINNLNSNYLFYIIPVDCPGWFSEAHALQAVALGFRVLVYCDQQRSVECGAPSTVEKWLSNLSQLPVYPKIVRPGWLGAALEELGPAITVENASLSRDKRDAYKILRAYGIESIEFSSPLAGRVIVDEDKCLLCDACSNNCYFNALKLVREDDSISLVFYPDRCTSCGLCEHSCPYSALRLRYEYVRSEHENGKVVLASDEIARCRRCGRPIGSMKHLKMIEKKLREAGTDPWVIESIWYCSECKVLRLLERNKKE